MVEYYNFGNKFRNLNYLFTRMLTQGFCEFLEYKLTEAFRSSSDISLRSFWCDGVLLPFNEGDFSAKAVNDRRTISMTAFCGETGQDQYELVLIFGNKSLSRYARGLDIKDCILNFEDFDCLRVDRDIRRIDINLP
jgi:hypothetical protein